MNELLGASEEALLETLGRSIETESLGMFPPFITPAEARRRAAEWLGKHRQELQTALCTNSAVRKLESSAETELLFHLVCEVLTATLTGIHIGAVAAYLVKKGLHALCESAHQSA